MFGVVGTTSIQMIAASISMICSSAPSTRYWLRLEDKYMLPLGFRPMTQASWGQEGKRFSGLCAMLGIRRSILL